MVDQRELEAWLRERPGHAIVGQARNPVGDPLANFFVDRLHQAVLVGRRCLRTKDTVVALPAWARQFQQRVDLKKSFEPITAAEALTILAEARGVSPTETAVARRVMRA